MREMKDSGVEWLNVIPNNWDVKRLKQILAERNEKNNPIKSTNLLSLSIEKGVFPYSEKTGGGNKAKENFEDYKLTHENDIVLNSMNVVVGAVGLSKYYGCVSPVYYTLYSRNENYNINYYNNIFQSEAFQKSLWGLGNGIVVKESDNGKLNTIRMRIPMEKLNNVLMPIPPKEEQEKISRFLDKKIEEINNVIEKTKKTIEDYKKYKQSIITKTITKGLQKNIDMKETGIEWIGSIPFNWEIVKIRNLGTLQNGISTSSEKFGTGFPFANYGDIYNNYSLPEKLSGLINSTENERNIYSIKRGDIFFTRTSETIEEIGFSCACESDVENACFSGFLIRFRPNNNFCILPEYYKYYFRSELHRKYFVKEMNIVTRASLGQNLLKSMPVVIPPIDIQVQLSKYLDEKCAEIDNLIQSKEKIIEELENYKKSLIYEYVTGKKEVI